MSKRFLMLGAMVAGLAFSAQAQSPGVDAAMKEVLACQQIEDSAERLACLDYRLIQLEKAQALAEMKGEEAAPETVSTPVATVAETPRSSPSVSQPAKVAVTEPDVPSWAAAPEQVTKVEEKRREKEPNEFEITIVRVSKGTYDRFYTDDGQIWEQLLSEDRVEYPETIPFVATVKKKAWGKPVIQFPNLKRTYKVKRIK